MTPVDHYREANRILSQSWGQPVLEALAHAVLANVPAEVVAAAKAQELQEHIEREREAS